ncbi:alpha/beta hydrolase [Luteimonas sp. SDU82]|uniref:alpha/beta hydrolase n=1 Tax=Luteimonas sp. SDU82 TaxID=3422592 RepID=UPI003EBB99B3
MIRSWHSLAAAVLLGGALVSTVSTPVRAAPAGAASAEVRLPQSRQWTMRAANGRDYEIFVAVPEGAPPAGGFATLYVLDGNAMFLTTAEAVRAYARRRESERDLRALVVGIGYPEGVDIPAARTLDLTPAVPEPRARHATGGADAFLDFILDELRPRIAREFSIDPGRQGLMGHSYGGLFTIGALTRRPEAFQTWIGMSSSFWFGQHDLSARIDRFAQARTADAAPVRVQLTAGEFEQQPRPGEWALDPERAASAARDLEWRGQSTRAAAAARALAQAPGIVVDFRQIAGEDHGSVIPAAIARGVDFFFNAATEVPPVPTADAYLALGADGRYRLRMQVRALPDLHRIPWLNGLKASLKAGLDREAHAALHAERMEMDARYGSRPHENNAD